VDATAYSSSSHPILSSRLGLRRRKSASTPLTRKGKTVSYIICRLGDDTLRTRMATHNILYSIIRQPLEMTVKDGEQLGASRHPVADFAPNRNRPIHRIAYHDHHCMSL
jgi:hypothetical protein